MILSLASIKMLCIFSLIAFWVVALSSIRQPLFRLCTSQVILSAPFDGIVDGSDNFPTRYLVNDTCVELKKLLVYGSISNYEAQMAVFNYKGGKNLRDIPSISFIPILNPNVLNSKITLSLLRKISYST